MMKSERSGVQGHPYLQRELKATLGYPLSNYYNSSNSSVSPKSGIADQQMTAMCTAWSVPHRVIMYD